MLAQNFKTAKELGLKEEQRDALIKTLGALERGEITDRHFDMGTWNDMEGCETVACLGGWAEKIGDLRRHSLDDTSEGNGNNLAELFYPPSLDAMHGAKVAQGASALRNYLTTGFANWKEVMRYAR